jgi:NADPH-dependent 2,4-dienoyl-CoA reductase/sulfur reductase-like enzyme/peroxiredoxin family protein/rhodanese-related sulfurtransferase/TusA-related sulfurtransferase
MKTIIIGGVAGGATAAARLRRQDEGSEIILVERGEDISYANCGLPYYIGGVITERDRLFVQTPLSLFQRFRIDVRTRSEALRLDLKRQQVEIRDLRAARTYEESYDRLVLSPGAEPVKPPIPGINQDGIFTLRNVPDTDRIHEYIERNKPRRALIVGAGFIGLEMAENLHRRGIFVTIVEMAEQVMTPLDYEMAAEVHQHLRTKNVEFYLREAVASFGRVKGRITARLSSGRELPVDLVVLGIGVRPDSDLARHAGLKVGARGGIVVNEFLQTSDANVYALGDAIEFPNPIIGRPMNTYLAGPANKQGRIVADNIAQGNTRRYKGAIGTAIAKVFDLTVASTGLSEKALKAEGVPYLSSITHSASHAGYYPDAFPMSMKIVFSPDDGRLLGAQIVGYQGVDKRIDVMATILKEKGSIYDLEEVEHAYAPPYSSAKDPVNVAGFVAENILKGLVRTVQWSDLVETEQDGNAFLLDVREPEEYAIGRIETAVNIPLGTLRERLGELPRDRRFVVYCGVGLRAYIACRILIQNGFPDVYNLSGGYKTYEHVTRKQSNEDIFEHDIIGKDDDIYQALSAGTQTAPAGASAAAAATGRGGNGGGGVATTPARRVEVDASGLQCPGPIMRLKKEVDKLGIGDQVVETATDPGFGPDVQAWCDITGNRLLSLRDEAGRIIAVVEKAPGEQSGQAYASEANGDGARNASLVVFSDDFDKALACLVIANGAAAAGKKVTMFFTFWGLNILRKRKPAKVQKDMMGRMFERMLPRGSRELKLSKLNMMGMGAVMMRRRMESLKIDSLEQMLQNALESGVEIVACQMSMDVMGIRKEELIDGIRIGGVATYLSAADRSRVNLFI